QRWTVVKIFVEKVVQSAALFFYGWAESGDALGMSADIFERMHACGFYPLCRVRNQVSDKAVKNTLQRLVKNQFLSRTLVAASGVAIVACKQIHAVRDLLDR